MHPERRSLRRRTSISELSPHPQPSGSGRRVGWGGGLASGGGEARGRQQIPNLFKNHTKPSGRG
eukprot:4332530-Pyramimonas_sp.AAC.1